MNRDDRTGLAFCVAVLSGLLALRHVDWPDALAVGWIVGMAMIWADALTGRP